MNNKWKQMWKKMADVQCNFLLGLRKST